MGLDDETRRLIAETTREIEELEHVQGLAEEFDERELAQHSTMLRLAWDLGADTAREAVELLWQDPARRAAFRQKATAYAGQRTREEGLRDRANLDDVVVSTVREHGKVSEDFLHRKIRDALVEADVRDEYLRVAVEAQFVALLEIAQEYADVGESQTEE